MSLTNSIKKLPPVNVDSLLKHLEREKSAAAADKKPMPRLTAWLGTGAGLSGEFVAYQTTNRHDHPVLLLQSNVGGSAADLTYIPGHVIASVTMHIVSENVHLLAFGTINEQHSGEAPTKMQIESQMNTWASNFAASHNLKIDHQVNFADLPPSDQAKFTLKKLLTGLHQTLDSIAGDPLGREALGEKVQALTILLTADTPNITLEKGALTIHCQNTGDDILTPAVKELRTVIESLL